MVAAAVGLPYQGMLPGGVGDHGRATTTPATQPVLIRLKFIYEYLFMKVWYVKVHQGLPYQGMLPGEVGVHGRVIGQPNLGDGPAILTILASKLLTTILK